MQFLWALFNELTQDNHTFSHQIFLLLTVFRMRTNHSVHSHDDVLY